VEVEVLAQAVLAELPSGDLAVVPMEMDHIQTMLPVHPAKVMLAELHLVHNHLGAVVVEQVVLV